MGKIKPVVTKKHGFEDGDELILFTFVWNFQTVLVLMPKLVALDWTLMKKFQPVVRDRKEYPYRYKSMLRTLFGCLGFWIFKIWILM